MKKKYDEHGQERIFGAIIFVTLSIILVTLMVGQLQQLQNQAALPPTVNTGWDILSNGTLHLWNPTSGYKCNESMIRSETNWLFALKPLWNHDVRDEGKMAEWWEPGTNEDDKEDCNIYLYVVEGNTEYTQGSESPHRMYEDYFLFYRHTGWWDQWWTAIPYDEIIDNAEGNTSYVDFKLDQGHYYTLVIRANISDALNQSFSAQFEDHNYTMYLGKRFTQEYEEMQETDFLGILGQLMTFSLPNMHWAINIIIAAPIWIAIGFIIFTLIERLIPG